MIKKLIDRWLLKRHFWRYAGFDELSEIYASQFLRSLALNIISIFVPIYLYKIGYSLGSLFFMYFVWFAIRPLYSLIAAKCIANFGPKHCIALANVIHIIYLTLVISIEDLRWPLALIALVGSLATTMFIIAFEVDFSKIKHSEHGGKELCYEHIFEKIGAILGPVVGGLVASYLHPRYTIAMAIIVLSGSLVPIFMSAEPTHTHQKITYQGFPWRRHKRDFISGMAFNVENLVTVFIWPVFIAITVFTSNTFAILGFLTAISTLVALIAIYSIGRLIDDRRGGVLLKTGVIANAVLHLFRPFANSFGFILGINIANEPITAAYRIPYEKGRYDAADSIIGYRIVYFSLINIVAGVASALFFFSIWLSTFFFNTISILQACFVIGSFASLVVLSQRFLALRDN